MQEFPDNSIDADITDPPYGLAFMGKEWDHGIPGIPFWKEILRVSKPGSHMLAFGGTRTHHRLMVSIEDAGWEIRDCLMWLYGSGFPKSLDVSKAIDKAAGARRKIVGNYKRNGSSYQKESPHNQSNGKAIDGRDSELIRLRLEKALIDGIPVTTPATPEAKQWNGWGTALKPAWEPIILARKPFPGTVAENVLQWGTGAINVDGCRIEYESTPNPATNPLYRKKAGYKNRTYPDANSSSFKVKHVESERNQNDKGRWPTNLLLDEEAAALLDEQSGILESGKPCGVRSGGKGNAYGYFNGGYPVTGFGDSGGASRFFYTAKASTAERNKHVDGRNNHPTVKPVDLLRYLCKLITPPGGVILDPFCGSGSTGVAAFEEGFDYILIEKDPESYKNAKKRNAGKRITDFKGEP